ncbi:MAG: PAS domain S-box protein, partial [archaeon]
MDNRAGGGDEEPGESTPQDVGDFDFVSRVNRELLRADGTGERFRTALRLVCEEMAWIYGEVWVPNDDGTRLVNADTVTSVERLDAFAELSRSVTFHPNEGLPGRVWTTGETEVLEDVTEASVSRYRRLAASNGLNLGGAVGVPVGVDDVDAVFVYYTSGDRPISERSRAVVETVASILVSYLPAQPDRDEPDGRPIAPDRFRKLVDQAPEGIFVVDPETSAIVDANETACRQLGYDHDELCSMTVLDIDPEFTMESWTELVDTVQTQGEASLQSVNRHKNGTRQTVEIQVASVSLDSEYLVSTVSDVTEWKRRERRIEAERKRALERYERIVESIGDAFYVLDTDGRMVEVNESMEDLTGYDRSELVGEHVSIVLSEADVEKGQQVIDSLRAEDGPRVGKYEQTIHTADGDARTCEIRQTLLRSNDGEIRGTIGTIRDVTDRREQEREIEALRRRYEGLFEAAPDPIFVADVDTGEIVEANTAAATIRDQPREEIVGLHQTDLHPDGEADRYRELFEWHVEQETTVSQFDDGSPVYMVTAEGEKIPVAISTRTVSIGDRDLIHGIFRDISERIRYESALEGVNSAARELLHAETDTEIANVVVETATEILDVSGIGIYLYEERKDRLIPVAYNTELKSILGDVPQFSPGDGVIWRVFSEGEMAHFDDVRTAPDVYNAGTPIRSELQVPVGDHGVLLVGDTAVGSIDDTAVELCEILAATASAALDRAHQIRTLRERERESKLQSERLERVRQLNEAVRLISRAIVRADSRESIKQTVCDRLGDLEQFDCAWIGALDVSNDSILPQVTQGVCQRYIESVSLAYTAENSLPAVRAARGREPVVESNLSSDATSAEWRNTALFFEFRSLVSVPLLHDDVLYGVLTIYSDRPDYFDDLSVGVLSDLGALIGYALNAVDQRNALLMGGSTDVTFEFTGAEDAFVELATGISTDVRIEHITSRSADSYIVHFLVEDVDPEVVIEYADASPAFESIQLIGESDGAHFEAISVGECIATTVAKLGANLQSIMVSADGCTCTLSIPMDRDIGTFLRHLRE